MRGRKILQRAAICILGTPLLQSLETPLPPVITHVIGDVCVVDVL